jgi:hypothetical protein
MEGDKEKRIKVLIHLSSRFLCEALQVFLEKDFTYWTVVAHSQDNINGFVPHIVLVDAISLGKSRPGQWHEAKVILIDTGLSDGEMTRLLTTHQLRGVISTGTGTELFMKALAAINAGQIWIDHDRLGRRMNTDSGLLQQAGMSQGK